jgi:nucleoside-diphosphate-sugar epimerase|tara:strand:+ start:309 stop:1136 length:828 start_codon:yes stop_codon:yes gene_type:complete
MVKSDSRNLEKSIRTKTEIYIVKILLAGGSGGVGSATIPYLRTHHEVRVLDLTAPAHDVEFVQGSIADPDALDKALDGVDSFITMVMQGGQDGLDREHSVEQAIGNYQTNCLGLHLLLLKAFELGIKAGVHTSTMSAHNRNRRYYPSEEEVPLDGPNVYGLSKGFSEQICRYFAREYDMSLAALRISGPRNRAQFIAQYNDPPRRPWGQQLYLTDEEDLANAYLSALEFVHKSHGRFDAFFIAGDAAHEEMNMSKARSLLGWEPLAAKKLGLESG